MRLNRLQAWGLAAFIAVFCIATLPRGAAQAENFVGAERCKSCHAFEYEKWAQGPHARSHKSLTEKQLADARCNSCHTMAPGETEPKFLGVQCEQCHGPGRYYHPSYVMKDKVLARAVGLITQEPGQCTQCHNEGSPSIFPFEYQRLWAIIDHGPEARAAAERAAENSAP